MSRIGQLEVPPALLRDLESRSAVNWRSVLLGLLGVVFICGLTPFNDSIVNNTMLVGNYFPPGVVLFYVPFVLLVNAPLQRWAPRFALSGAELAVALGMMLVGCGLPGGLMRYLPIHLISILHHATEINMRELLEALQLPDWIFPTLHAQDPAARAYDPVVTQFFARLTDVDVPTFWNYFRGVPWAAWAVPALTWGVLLLGLWTAMLCLVVLVHRQWAENERLPFPLASVYVALIEPAPRGKMLNGLFSARSFWIAVALTVAIHSLGGLHEYQKQWPEIPLKYDFSALFSERPWFFMDPWVKKAAIYFSVIGISYFVQTQLLFSLWFFVVVLEVFKMAYGDSGGDWSEHSNIDQMLGGIIPFTLGILWIGRQHWMLVLRQMLRGARHNEMRGRYLPYPVAGYGLLAGMAVMVIWLWLAGCTVIGAVCIVVLMMMLVLVALRMVAETGLLFVQTRIPLQQPFLYALQNMPAALAVRPKLQTFFFAGLFSNLFTIDQRESVPVFASQALRVADLETDSDRPGRQRPVLFTFCLMVSLVIGYVVSGASTLYVEYRYAATLDRTNTAPINNALYTYTSKTLLLQRTYQMMPPGNGLQVPHNRFAHFAGGAALTTALTVLRLRFASWPLHPIGFLLLYTNPVHVMWFSLLIGWVIKVAILHFGGGQLYRSARAFFIGLIVGEAFTAAMWLMVSLARLSMGAPYEPIWLLPR